MNSGFREGKRLADFVRKVLREDASLESLGEYDREQIARWRQLLGLTGGLKAGPETDAWVAAHAAQLLPCLPGSGSDLEAQAQALKLTLAQNELSISGQT